MNENEKKKQKEPQITGEEKKQHGLFKKKRGGQVLTKDEVKEIKAGRKKLRKDMRKAGIKSKKEFELTASSLGLYFDKNRFFALLWWWLLGKGGWILLALGALMLALLYAMSLITQMRGHFTISMSDELFREGFTLSETADFANPTSHLFATPAESVPCLSIYDIPSNIDDFEGTHSTERYFAHSYYIRNEGDSTAAYKWELRINSQSQNLSDAAWVMILEDDEMMFFAKPQENGEAQALPAVDDNSRGYLKAPLIDIARYPDKQYEVIAKTDAFTYWRVIPMNFQTDEIISSGVMFDVEPMEVHKYTVIVWLEGDDPDCTNEKIGGHMGLDWYITMVE